jgi:hypothetical protein
MTAVGDSGNTPRHERTKRHPTEWQIRLRTLSHTNTDQAYPKAEPGAKLIIRCPARPVLISASSWLLQGEEHKDLALAGVQRLEGLTNERPWSMDLRIA